MRVTVSLTIISNYDDISACRIQVVITLILISVQVVGAVIWLVLEPPDVRPYHPFGRRDEVSDLSILTF